MEYIIEEINKKIEELKSKPLQNIEELSFFEKNLKFNRTNILTISSVNKAYFLLACMRLINNESPFEEDKKTIEYLKEDLNEADCDTLSRVLDALVDLSEKGLMSEITSLMPKTDKISLYNLEESLKTAKNGLKEIFDIPNKYREFIKVFDKYKDTNIFECFMHFDSALRIVKRNDVIEYLSKGSSIRKRGYINNMLLNGIELLGETIGVFDDIDIYYNALKNSVKKEKNSINKQYSLYEDLLYKFKANRIDITKDMIDFIVDESLKQDIILAILSKNKKEYQLLLEDYNNNKNFEINELDKILSTYGIIISNDSNKMLLLKNINIECIQNSLKELNSSLLEFFKDEEEKFIKILLLSDSNIISNISNLYSNNIFPLDFIKNNIGIFISNKKDFTENENEILEQSEIEPLYDRLSSNIKILSENNICLYNIKKYNINFLLKDTNDLIDNINIINSYNIDLNDSNLINFTIIDDIKQLDVVDSFIELGMLEYLKSHIELINSNMNVIKKILLFKELDSPIFDINNTIVNEIIGKNKFYIPDSSLDQYLDNSSLSHLDPDCYITLLENKNTIISNEILYNQLILNLEKNNKISNNEYSFDGIIISRNKVLRNMSTLKSKITNKNISDKDLLVNSILYNTILPEESIQVILDKVDSINNKILKKNYN